MTDEDCLGLRVCVECRLVLQLEEKCYLKRDFAVDEGLQDARRSSALFGFVPQESRVTQRHSGADGGEEGRRCRTRSQASRRAE